MTPDQIKKLRNAKKLSVREFAEKIGVSPRTVEAWEQGARTPSAPAQMLMKKVFRT